MVTIVANSERHSPHHNTPELWEIYLFIKGQPFAKVLESLSYAATLTDGEDRFLYVNRAFARAYGYAATQVIGLTPRLLLPQNQAARLREVRQLLRREAVEVELENIDRYDRRFMISLRAFPVALRLWGGGDVKTLYLGIGCPLGHEIRRDREVLRLPWAQLARLGESDTAPRIIRPEDRRCDGVKLSARETQIKLMDLVGCETKQIADSLGISGATVRVLRARLRRKMDNVSPFAS